MRFSVRAWWARRALDRLWSRKPPSTAVYSGPDLGRSLQTDPPVKEHFAKLVWLDDELADIVHSELASREGDEAADLGPPAEIAAETADETVGEFAVTHERSFDVTVKEFVAGTPERRPARRGALAFALATSLLVLLVPPRSTSDDEFQARGVTIEEELVARVYCLPVEDGHNPRVATPENGCSLDERFGISVIDATGRPLHVAVFSAQETPEGALQPMPILPNPIEFDGVHLTPGVHHQRIGPARVLSTNYHAGSVSVFVIADIEPIRWDTLESVFEQFEEATEPSDLADQAARSYSARTGREPAAVAYTEFEVVD